MSAQLTIIERPTEPESYWDLAALPAGSMWRVPEHDLPDRECWRIVLPNMAGLWETTERAGRSGMLWSVTGIAPALTVTPSLNAGDGPGEGNWHGWITNGAMTP